MSAPISFVAGFTITAYQAFFHPNSPIYAPKEAILQIFLPSIDGNDDDSDLTLFYESEPFAVSHVASSQVFLLPKPVLAIGGRVNIILRGMYQRQTLADPAISMNMREVTHLDDYYTCISYLSVLGVPISGYSPAITRDVENMSRVTLHRDPGVSAIAQYSTERNNPIVLGHSDQICSQLLL